MPTSTGPILAPARVPLRLRLAERPGRDLIDGGWWPQGRDLAVELADLVDHYPAELGRIVRAWYAPEDWDPASRRIPLARGFLKVGSLPGEDTHMLRLKLADGKVVRLLVVPPGMSKDQGDEALLAAATPGNAHPAASILATVSEYPDVDPRDHWSDAGESWWGPRPVAPSFRTGA